MVGVEEMKPQIEKCELDAINLLREVSIETFKDTFQSQNSAENMKAYIEKAFHQEQLKQELLNPTAEFFFIQEESEVAGYLKLNIEATDTVEVERIYIRQQFQRRGLGKQLLEYAMERAKKYEKNAIWLGVWEKNDQALAFYKKLGFIRTGQHSFWMEDDEQIDYILTKKLT